jgi:nucleotide-binding universal stress UspA family protein
MSIRHILVPLTGALGEDHVPAGAMLLAKRLRAHVAVANVAPYRNVPYDMTGASMAPAYLDEVAKAIEKAQQQSRHEARRVFDAAVAETRLPMVNHPTCDQASAWYEHEAEGDSLLADVGRLSDLVVVNRPRGPGYVAELDIIEHSLFSLRRPVLLLPYEVAEIGDAVAVAWNGSLEAANALQAAIGLLLPTAAITLVQVGDLPEKATPVERAAEYLGWHGFTPTVRRVADSPKATTRIILTEAKNAGAHALVMGAYSHSRARELFFGGVTAAALEHADLPVLMAH